jgi:hypothetical protein
MFFYLIYSQIETKVQYYLYALFLRASLANTCALRLPTPARFACQHLRASLANTPKQTKIILQSRCQTKKCF